MNPPSADRLIHERAAWAVGRTRIGGVDEAGRGPWAGPVVAACVVFHPDAAEALHAGPLRRLTDSKQLTARQRDAFFDILQGHPAVWWAVGIVPAREIDAINILNATHRAMRRAIGAVEGGIPELLFIDGRPVPGLPAPALAFVGGDGLSLSIAAASVIAKVTRDRIMVELDRAHPAYGFASHKGYGTPAHRAALARHGPCPEHRRSFRPVRDLSSPTPPAAPATG